MKICVNCEKEFQEKIEREKYCSHQCSTKFSNRIHFLRRKEKIKSDPDFRRKYLDSENSRRKRKYNSDPEYRAKRLGKVFVRSREKAGIKSDEDLKKAPKGTGCLTAFGYRKISRKGHPNAWKNGEMFEHVFVMSEHLGRAMRVGETVHHRNGIRDDNRIENLELWSKSHPYGQRVQDKLKWCKEFLEEYGHEVIMSVSTSKELTLL